MDNVTWYPDFTARSNYVTMDSCRGFLITTRGKVLVEENTFNRCAMPGILIEDDARGWFESGPIRDMSLRRNRLIGCGIEINPQTAAPNPAAAVHQNIRIEGNLFENSGISAKGVAGLRITANQFSSIPWPIQTNACVDAVIADNKPE